MIVNDDGDGVPGEDGERVSDVVRDAVMAERRRCARLVERLARECLDPVFIGSALRDAAMRIAGGEKP